MKNRKTLIFLATVLTLLLSWQPCRPAPALPTPVVPGEEVASSPDSLPPLPGEKGAEAKAGEWLPDAQQRPSTKGMLWHSGARQPLSFREESPEPLDPAGGASLRATSGAGQAQDEAAAPLREVSVYGTLGLSQLHAGVRTGDMQPTGLAPGLGADFAYFFTQRWGVAAGLEAAFFSMQVFNARVGIDPPDGDADAVFLQKRTDRVYATYLRVPLWLRFRAPLWRHEFRAAAGAALDLALAGRRRTETETRTGLSAGTTGTSGSVHFGSSASLAAEAGLRWQLGARWELYTGVYGSYGLSSVFAGNAELPAVTDAHLFAVGAKVGVSFDFN